MIERQKVNLEKAAILLHRLKGDPNNLPVLLDLQKFLVRRIVATERAILRSKAVASAMKVSLSRDRLPKAKAKAVKVLIKASGERIKEYQHLLFIWKCFGDGIANIYFDKYALKHTFYNVEDYAAKEDAGFFLGKEGFRLEWRMVRMAIAGGKPILLCDITNVLRHGDICLMIGSDPFLVEVKSSKNRNGRVDRQLEHLKKLQTFMAEDGADEFRGFKNVRRVALTEEEVNHGAALNECIKRSYTEGTTVMSPELGIYYMSIVGDFDETKMESIPKETSAIFLINNTKREGVWMPYYPFTLSIEPEYVYGFIRGDIYLVVFVDLKIMQDRFLMHGLHATIINDGTWFLGLKEKPDDPDKEMSRISENLFLRIPLEFQSLAWFVDEQARLDTVFAERYLQLEDT
jgi:hypothetical protein